MPTLQDATGDSGVRLRPMTPADEAVARRAHIEHRHALFAPAGWPAALVAQVCGQQHEALDRHLATHHPDAERYAIEAAGTTAGRLCLDSGTLPWRIADIVLVPEAQGHGIGTAAIRLVLAAADAVGVAVALQVGADNPRAEALYRRLGFVDAADHGATHRSLVRPPLSRAEPHQRP